MIDEFFKTFITVVDEGSFTKASEKLFLSSTAIMKQMNSLESELDLKLINRTKHGIELTTPGRIIYERGKKLIEEADNIIVEARTEQAKYSTTFCVGTSLLNPARPFLDLWYKYNNEFKNYRLHLVPFQDDSNSIVNEISLLGVKYDFLIGVCDSKSWLSRCSFLKLGEYSCKIAVSRNNPLSKKDKLSLNDIDNHTIMMIKEGDSSKNDQIRNHLKNECNNLIIEDTDYYYDINEFNECAESNKLLLSAECWKEVHPGIVTLDVDWDFKVPYGIMYSKDSESDVLHFVEILKKNVKIKK